MQNEDYEEQMEQLKNELDNKKEELMVTYCIISRKWK
jgi:hypothetical protein